MATLRVLFAADGAGEFELVRGEDSATSLDWEAEVMPKAEPADRMSVLRFLGPFAAGIAFGMLSSAYAGSRGGKKPAGG